MSQSPRSVFIVVFPPYSLYVHGDLKRSDDDDDDQVSDLIDEAGNQDSRKGIYLSKPYPKGVVFWLFWSEIGYRLWPYWSQIGYGFCTLVLNCVCF